MKLERDNSVSRSLQLSTLAIPKEIPDVLGMKSTAPPALAALAHSHTLACLHTLAVHVSFFGERRVTLHTGSHFYDPLVGFKF